MYIYMGIKLYRLSFPLSSGSPCVTLWLAHLGQYPQQQLEAVQTRLCFSPHTLVPYMTTLTFCYTSPPINPYQKSTLQHFAAFAGTASEYQHQLRLTGPASPWQPSRARSSASVAADVRWEAMRAPRPPGAAATGLSLGRENSSLTKGHRFFFPLPSSPFLLFTGRN